MKAQDVIDRIQAATGAKLWRRHVDRVRAGDARDDVRGVAVTFMATVEVMRRSHGLGANMIVTHEPSFYSHTDEGDWHAGDPVVEAKKRLADELGVVIWRFHDGMHAASPDLINVGMSHALGWEPYRNNDERWFYTLPTTTVGQLACAAAKATNSRTTRIVGDPAQPCSRVALRVGAHPATSHIRDMRDSDADVLVVGEGPEWVSTAWVRDAAALGMRKAMILLGHCPSEEGGMRWCADWLRELLPDIPVHFVATGEPFTPAAA